MSENADEQFDRKMMRLALRHGAHGRPSPNPHVGAVLAKDGKIIATGYHAKAGQAHAEVVAIEKAGEATRGATLYVTFEPCNHVGRTGPCTDAILRAGIARVVVGARDPAPHVPGAIKKLSDSGVKVDVGVEVESATELVADFAQHITTGMPFVRLKAAMTLDGSIATRTRDSKWITSIESRRLAHRMRDASDAILVGVGTVLADDPALTVREVRGRDPIRVVLDTNLRTPPDAKVVRHGSKSPTWIVHGPDTPAWKRAALQAPNVELIEVPIGASHSHLDIVLALRELGQRGVVRLLAEGGGQLHGALLDAGVVRRASLFVAPLLLGDQNAVRVLAGSGKSLIREAWRVEHETVRKVGVDLLIEGHVVAPTKSA